MRKFFLLVVASSIPLLACAQDEGAVVKRERIQRDKSIFIGGGASIVGSSNFGDYTTGINFEGGYSKRLNRILSIGGSISYLKFKYDPSFLAQPPPNDSGPNFYAAWDNNQPTLEYGTLLKLSGGDLSLVSIAGNIKVNLVPVKDNSIVSVYGFVKPFLTVANRGAVSGDSTRYSRETSVTSIWGSPATAQYSHGSKSQISGGIFLGPGMEFFPGRKISFYLQASFGYTFPINIVSTRSYGHDAVDDLKNPDFPFKNLGFTSINFAGGVSFNLD